MKKFFSVIALLALPFLAAAHDFVTNSPDGQKLYFNISDAKKQTVSVTFEGSASKRTASAANGHLQIPAKVNYNGKEFRVTAIEAKAFAGATHLQSVTMPNGIVEIGDFAFEDCTSLHKIVFPGNPVKFGDGVFFRCKTIQNISLGSDWESVNLKMFRWSDCLGELYVPAKISKLHNLKFLRQLHTLKVDDNNLHFRSIKGLLYSRDGKTLYACPRNYYGEVEVAEGTEVIAKGAFADCLKLRKVDLPSTLRYISYEEFASQQYLDTLTFRSVTPVKTATQKGEEVFVLRVAKRNMVVQYPWAGRKEMKRIRRTEAGEFADTKQVLAPIGLSNDPRANVAKSLLKAEVLPSGSYHASL